MTTILDTIYICGDKEGIEGYQHPITLCMDHPRKSFPNFLYMVHIFMDTLVFDAGSV